MAGLSKVIVLDPDPRAGRQVTLGFVREGITATMPAWPADPASFAPVADDVGLVVVGGDDASLPMVTAVRAGKRDVPILFTGTATIAAAHAAGADEAVGRQGTFLRDVVTIGRLLANTAPDRRNHVVGQLSELTNVFSMVRALAVLGRSATLTLMRGLRRGEVRFFHGEVTSCELGLIHGQAAFHQLLLWTEARFDFRHEDIVRRQQIPLTHDELLVDAEHFLAGIRESSGILSPSMVLEQDMQRVHGLGKQIPTEVHGVLRMFDGHRVLADVLEDSPYRVFETLRVAQRAVEAGLLRIVQSSRPKATWRAVLAIEEWLVGADRDEVVDRTSELESGPTKASSSSGAVPTSGKAARKTRRNKKQRRANTPLPIPAAPAPSKTGPIDWGALVPRAIGHDIGTLSQIVPAAHASGEILQPPSRQIERERLESLMDTGKRDRIFPSDVTSGPSVVLDDGSKPHAAPPAAEIAPPPPQSRTKSAEFRDDRQDEVRKIVKVQATERAIANADARRALEARHVQPSDGRQRLENEIRARRDSEQGKNVVTDPQAAQLATEVATREAAEASAAEQRREAEATARRVEAQIKAANETAAAKALAAAIKGPTSDKASDLVAALISEVKTDAVTVVETGAATVTVQDTVRVTERSTTTSEIHAIPTATIKESSHPLAAVPISDLPTAPLATKAATPANGERPNRITGEVVAQRKSAPNLAVAAVASIVVDESTAVAAEASALIAAATKAADARAAKPTERTRASTDRPKTKTGQNIATPARDKAAGDLRTDAVAFSDDEEAFFRGGDDKHQPAVKAAPIETFDDLDEGYQRVGFWDRLIGRKPKKK